MNSKKIFFTLLGCLVFFFFSYRVFTCFYFRDFLHEVPDIVGLTEEEAEKALKKNDLEIKMMGEQYSALPVGQVSLQNPKAASTVKSGRRIQVWLSKGENLLTLPELVGMNLLTAQSLVEQQGLVVDKVNYLNKDLPYNEIIATDPDLTKPIPKGSKISFLVSGSGKTMNMDLKVPDIIGYPIEDAKEALLYDKLQIGKISYKKVPDMASNIVLETGIPVGRSVDTHTKIDLVVSQ